MWKNKRFIGVAIIIVEVSFISAEPGEGVKDAVRTPSAFEGRLEFHKPLAVGITAGTADYPELVRVESVCFDKRYGNAWGVTARVGWLPIKDATWRLTIELLDEDGRVLKHSRDEPTVFTGKAGAPGQTDMRYADLDLDSLQDQGRRHTARFRISLEPSEESISSADSTHTLEIALLDQESRKPITGAAVVVSSSYMRDTYIRYKALYNTNSQGCCRITLAQDGLVTIGISAQKQDYCTIVKSWSNYGSSALGRAPIVNLPQSHVIEMVCATALGGIVHDTEGNPIEGAEVRLEARLEEPGGTMNVNCAVWTDQEGRWRVEGVPDEAERITLRLKHAEYGGNNRDSRRITGEALANARAFKHAETLEKGLTIKGRVLDDRGQPVAGATALLSIRSYNPIYALTDASGAFRLTCSSDRSAYRETLALIVEAPGYAPVQQNIDLQPASETLEFRLKRGRDITCRVVDTEGQPVVGAWSVVEPLPDNRSYSIWLEDTDYRGEFQIPSVPKNDVKLTIGKQDYIAIRDHVLASSEDEVVVTMKRAMRVHGAVTDAETGKPIPNFEIAAVYATGSRIRTSRPVAFAEGTYEISFDEARPENRQLQVSAVGYEPATSDQINIDEGERTIDFKLARSASFNEATAGRPREQISPTGPRRITGMVRDEAGKPVPDAIVSTCPPIGEETMTNAKGAFTLKLRGTPGSMGSMRREEITYLLARQKERNLAVAMELDPSADTIDVTLAPGAILSGKVVDVEGKGIRNAELSLTFWTSSIGYRNREVTEIDDAGHYAIRALSPGQKYSVNASADGYGSRYVQVSTGDAANQNIEVDPLVLSVANLSASGIVVDDFDQPLSGFRIYAYGNGQPSRETFTDTKGQFTIENVCPGELSIQANSEGVSTRRFHGRTQGQGGATNIKIVVYELDKRGRRIASQPPSLAGKALPDLKELGIDALPIDLTGKRILVCFWDMNQRPSRHCMTQLAKQFEPLKQKGVIVLAVQASKTDRNALDEWTKKYNVPFSAIVEGDAKKTRFDWGVKSLPWLILTDQKHIVEANGFSLAELDERI